MSKDRFTFRLSRLLSIRERKEADAAVAYNVAREEVDTLRTSRDKAAAEVDAARQTRLPRQGTTQNVGDARSMELLIDQINRNLNWIDDEIENAEEISEAKLKTLSECLRDRRILERLRDRKQDQWTVESQRHAREVMDSVAMRMSTLKRDAES